MGQNLVLRKYSAVFFLLISFLAPSSYALFLNLVSPEEDLWAATQADQFCKELKTVPLSQLGAKIYYWYKPSLEAQDGERLAETMSLALLDQDMIAQLVLRKGLTRSTFILMESRSARARINACRIPGLDPTALFYFRIVHNEMQARLYGILGVGAISFGLGKVFHKGWLMLEKGADRFDFLRWVQLLAPSIGKQLFMVFSGYMLYGIGVDQCKAMLTVPPKEELNLLQESAREHFSELNEEFILAYKWLINVQTEKLRYLQANGLNLPLQKKIQTNLQSYQEKLKKLMTPQKEEIPKTTRTGVSLKLQYFCEDLTAFANKVRMSEK